jgi:predicted nucleic acid-binding Zn ribbon protein
MILVWGYKGYCDLLGYVIERCPQCNTTGPFSVKQLRKKFTVYFIPTFAYSCKQYAECFACHSTFEIAKEQKERIAGALMNQDQLAALIREVQASVAHDRAARQAGLAQPVQTAGRLIASSDPVQQARIDREAEQNATKQCPYCAESIKRLFSKVSGWFWVVPRQISGSMQVRILRRRYSSSRSP